MGAYPSGEALWREPDHRQLPRLLRARRERPRGRAAERGKEFSSSDVACHVTLRLGARFHRAVHSVPCQPGLDCRISNWPWSVRRQTRRTGDSAPLTAQDRARQHPLRWEPGCALPNRLEQVPVAARIGQDGSSGDRGSIHGR
jgi:hypothetical protein